MGIFKWIEIVISLLVLSLTFQLKANDCVWNISCICLHANEGRASNTKDSVYNIQYNMQYLNFQSFVSGKKVHIIQG